MKIHKLADMTRGWFVGDFTPAAFQTDKCEIAIKSYKAGDGEASHRHAQATELTAVVSGLIEMNGQQFGPGDIVTIEPNEYCSFKCLNDAVTVVYKSASVRNDKFAAEKNSHYSFV